MFRTMKKFYLFVLCLFLFNTLFAGNIVGTTNNGSWQSNGTWNLNRKPQSGDTITIPAGKTIVVSGQISLNNVFLKVHGTVKFSGLLSYLSLDGNSKVLVQPGGKVQSTIDLLQYLILGGQTIFFAGEVTGPRQASVGSNGFQFFDPLPVKFIGFSLTRRDKDVLVQWSTAEEVNASMYELERSLDGRNWDVIAYVSAIGNSSEVNNYSYTDKNMTSSVAYYRIRQVDVDGTFTYTDIKVIRTENKATANVVIASLPQKVMLQFPEEIKGKVIVRFVNTAGQVVDQQQLTNPVGQVILNSKVTGMHIISLSNGQDLNIARQVIL